MPTRIQAELRADEVDMLRRQCSECKLGAKDITPRGGCEVRKKLVIDQSEVAWSHKQLFFDDRGKCKMFQEKERKVLK